MELFNSTIYPRNSSAFMLGEKEYGRKNKAS